MPEVGKRVLFRTVVADPPWPELGKWTGTRDGRIGWKYDLMTYDQIDGLAPYLHSLVAPQAHLYLWATYRSLEHAFTTMRTWGFNYKCVLTWCKPIGLGHFFRSSTEHLLFGTRGSNFPLVRRDIGTHFIGKRRGHSTKPQEAYDIIESVSPGPYLELFARNLRPGWSVWGNEVRSDVEII